MHKNVAPASFFCQYRGNFRTSTQYFRPNFCTSTHAAAPSVVYLYVAKKLLQWEHKRCIFRKYNPVVYTLFLTFPALWMYCSNTSQQIIIISAMKFFPPKLWIVCSSSFYQVNRLFLPQNQFTNHFIVLMLAPLTLFCLTSNLNAVTWVLNKLLRP